MNSSSRQAFIDQLRGFVTLLVVLHHTAITYGGSGGWYYKEAPANAGAIVPILLTLMCAVDQAWFMGAFFLFAGYFTPGPLERKGVSRYFTDRAVRLGIPLLVFAFFLDALTNSIADLRDGGEFLPNLGAHLEEFAYYPGPLWFVQALLVFAAIYAVWTRFRPATLPEGAPLPPHSTLAWAAIGVGAVAFVVRLAMPVGAEVWHWQLGYFPMYVLLFAVGCAAAGPRWLERIDERYARLWGCIACVALPVLPAFALAHRAIEHSRANVQGGLNVSALLYAMWEPFVAWGVILVLLWFFRTKVRPDRFANLSRRAYAIYCFHPPVVVGISIALRSWDAPALLKFAATGGLSCAALYVLCGLLLRIPGISRVW